MVLDHLEWSDFMRNVLEKFLLNIERTTGKKKNRHILERGILLRTMLPAVLIMFLFDMVGLGYIGSYTFENLMIKLPLLLLVGYDIGRLEYEFYSGIKNSAPRKEIRNKFILCNGVIGWGVFCGILLTTFYPLNILMISIEMLVWVGGGLLFGVFMYGMSRPVIDASIEYYQLQNHSTEEIDLGNLE